MNGNQLDLEKLIKVISNLDFNQYFKETLLSTLNLIINNSTSEPEILDFLVNLIKIREEVKIYEICEVREAELAFYLLAKEFFRFKSSRSLFYKEIKFDYEREKLSCNWIPFLFIGLFELFMCNTNEIEINRIFKEDISIFHEFFYTLVLADVSEEYYESDSLLDYSDCEVRNIPGKEFSKFIKLQIQKCIESEDNEQFYKIYKKFFDILETNDLLELFSGDTPDFILFLLKHISDNNVFDLNMKFNFHFRNNLKLNNIISKTLINILPDYLVDEWNDPLYLLGFFDCLTKEHIQYLIHSPKVDFFELLMKNRSTESSHNGKMLKKFIEEKDVDFCQLCRNVIKENNLEKIYWFWDRWLLFDLFEIEDLKKLLEDPDINFIERLLKSAYLFRNKDEIGGLFNFPDKLKYNLRSLMVKQITQVIRKNEEESFIPLLAIRLLDYFSTPELLILVQDNEINLLNKINDALELHYSEIMDLNERFYKWKINFFKFLTRFNFPVSEQIDTIEPGERLIVWLYPPDEEVEESYNSFDNVSELKGLKEYVTIAERKIYLTKGVLDLSGLNLYTLEDVEGLFKLKAIKVLSLSNNYIEKLPDEIGYLISLEQLIIENCNLTSIPESIGKLTNIKKINFHKTNISSLPESFGNLLKLEILDLSFNNLNRPPNSFKNLINLKDLNLRNNKLNNISDWIGDFKKLRRINLMVNRDIKKIPESIGNLKSLRELNLWETGIEALPKTIWKLKKLKRLDLSNTYLREIPTSIGDLPSLEHLSCVSTRWNHVMKIPDSLLNCRSLQTLRLNRKTIERPSPIIEELRNRGVNVSY